MPVYELKGEELYNFPWNHDNIDEWLYRPVKIVGRPIYRQLIRPRVFEGFTPGYHLITPIVTDEDENFHPDTRKGILLNQGWCPLFTLPFQNMMHEWDSSKPVEYTAFVSQGEDHRKFFRQGGNIDCEQKFEMNEFYLPDMARATRFLNKDQVRVACLEKINLDTPMNEKHPGTYDGKNMCNMKGYPYEKTMSGALQCNEMPWDFARKQQYWSATAMVTGVVGLAAKCKGF